MKTAAISIDQLDGSALEWAVASAQRLGPAIDPIDRSVVYHSEAGPWCRARFLDWAEAGPVIERERISVEANDTDDGEWCGSVMVGDRCFVQWAPSPLIAAMRVFVQSKLGDQVEIPAELLPAPAASLRP
jgi:hypothetical protein